jgi:hypothetical protein
MAEFDDGPTVIQLDYVSQFGPHSQRFHAVEWNPVPVTGGMGSFLDWNGVPRDAEDMIGDMVALLKELHIPETTYTLATIFSVPAPGAPLIPVASKALAVVGTSPLVEHSKAIQSTMSMRSSLFHAAKIVNLDVPHDATEFDKQNIGTMGTAYLSVFDEYAADGNAWCAKDGAQVITCISLTWNINQALRKQYGMA